ncbi:hypothetical protein SEA_NOODLETREE_8 [Mycobacterium phage NoodleTree]|uniref:Uncharacterized protein n=4 Tax=Bixzunavirus TaxID=680114 RepID=A0A411CCG0_9CAUD|nr:hypothetical protein KHO62_gp008 [Mycobacterium phage NoodleTree]QAY11557.1 hypothetical protein SEA_NOODLETREE_8 [Mycobacterium phage NoodleTree]QPL13348.1 hypothetical protein SEA_STEPHANIEG_10 [Mycobacterium phage StephanieG]UTN92500.1 hypothetical protein SEA_MIKRO_8 [Mycobacterium phage Mikro]
MSDFPSAEQQAGGDHMTPRMVSFADQQELEDYVEKMNQAGIMPDLGIIDSRGNQVLACRTAPGGDGYAFVYYAPDTDDGMIHCCGCAECDHDCEYAHRRRDWRPFFPVWALVGFDVDSCVCKADGDHDDCPVHP